MNYYPFHIGDYTTHTAHLELFEDLAYRRLLDLYYMREGHLPVDTAECARLIRMRGHEEVVASVLGEFFTFTDDGWYSERCSKEIERMVDKQAKAQASAQASVAARKAKAERTLNDRSTTVELPTPTPTPTPTPVKEKSAIATRLPDDWKLPVEWADWSMANRADLNPYKVAEQFADYWRAQGGARAKKVDWLATWRNWVRNQKQGAAGHGSNAGGETAYQRNVREQMEQLAPSVARSSPSGATKPIFDVEVVESKPKMLGAA